MRYLRLLAVGFVLAGLVGCGAVPSEPADDTVVQEEIAEEALTWEDNGLPVLSLKIDPQEFEKINESPDHSYRASGASISIQVPDGYKSKDGVPLAGTDPLELDYIRGRGHGTWAADKKPYRFKLDKSADLLGMGANKHWILLANRFDATLLRNRVVAYMGEQIGMAYTPESVPVDLLVNGEYYGSYVLCEQIRIDENRLEIDQLAPENAKEPEISGGYLVCMYPDYGEAEENVFVSDRMVRFGNEDPQFSEGEDGTAEQKKYITDYIQRTEDAVFADGTPDDSGKVWSDYMDAVSAADYWWIQEYSGNHDAFITSSTYLYKEREGKLFWGPLWDFDLALGDGLDTVEGFLHRNMIWLDHLRACDKDYQNILAERWKALDPVITELVRDGGVIDKYAEEVKKSWEDDQRRWMVESEDGAENQPDFDEEVTRLKTWMKNRQDWINVNIDQELTHVYQTVTFVADQKAVQSEEVLTGFPLNRLPQAPFKEGFIFSHWADEEGQPYDYENIDRDISLHAVYLPQEEAGITEAVCFANPQDVWADIHSKKYEPVYELLPYDTIDKNIRWSSSNEELAEVDEYGLITLKGIGEVTIRAELCSGAENSFVLHIYDPSQDSRKEVETLTVPEEEFTLQTGESGQIQVSVSPSLCDCYLLYSIDNEAVATVDAFGVVQALEPGEATVTVQDSQNPDCSVIVRIKVQ